MNIPIVLLVALCVLPQPGHAAEPSPQGHALAAPCLACHGPTRTYRAIPSLAGLDVAEITRAMQEFRAGRRPSSIMGRIALGYGDAEIALIAESLSGPRE